MSVDNEIDPGEVPAYLLALTSRADLNAPRLRKVGIKDYAGICSAGTMGDSDATAASGS